MEVNWKKNTALFIAAQALTFFGTMIVQYAIFWHVTLKSQSGTMMMYFTIVGFLPMFFIAPFAGVWADRFNRKYIINIADGSIAFFSLAVAIVLMFGVDSYAILFACAFVRSIGRGVQTPAVNAFIPQIVPQEYLTKVNGIHGSINSFISLATPMIAAALMAFTPLHVLFIVDVITTIIGIGVLLFFVKIPAKARAEIEAAKQRGTAYFHDLKEGLKYIRSHGYVLRMIIITAIYIFLISPCAFLTPLQVVRNFGEEVWRLSVMEVVYSAGMVAGGLLITVWAGLKNRVYTMTLSIVLTGIFCVGLGVTPIFWLYLVVVGILGLTAPYYNTTAMVLLQTTVEPAFMGRVLAVFTMVTSSLMPLGMLLFGPLADKISIDIIMVITGGMILFLGIPMMTSKTLRAAGLKYLEAEPAKQSPGPNHTPHPSSNTTV